MARNDLWPVPIVDLQLCDGCGICIDICPTKALGMMGGQAKIVNPQACHYDAACEDRCPTGAIRLPYIVVLSDTSDSVI
jgi:NAD-dependent dihydropyrimidine dehydrogenase PreA subunit